jgi:hypothetical protein
MSAALLNASTGHDVRIDEPCPVWTPRKGYEKVGAGPPETFSLAEECLPSAVSALVTLRR